MKSNSILLKGLLFFSMFCGGIVAWLYTTTPAIMAAHNLVPMIWGIDARLIAAAITIIGLGGILTTVARPPNQ